MKKIMLAGLAAMAIPAIAPAQTPIASYTFETTPSIFDVKRGATATADSSGVVYNYAAYTPSSGVKLPGNVTSIPFAPGTSTKNALRFDANHKDAAGATDGVNFYPTTQTLVKHTMEFDLYVNTNGPLFGNSTEFFLVGAADGTRCEWTQGVAAEGSSGFALAFSGDGGSSTDARAYFGTGATTFHSRSDVTANYNGANEVDAEAGAGWNALLTPGDETTYANPNAYETTGCLSKQWTHFRQAVDGNVVRLFITGRNRPETLVSQFVQTGTGISAGSKPFVGYVDIFSSVPAPVADQFALIDNLTVYIPAPAPNAAKDWVLYE